MKARQQKKNLVQAMILLAMIFCAQGCTREANYRGIPEPTWQHLSAEQKQLIVDRAYQDEMKKTETD